MNFEDYVKDKAQPEYARNDTICRKPVGEEQVARGNRHKKQNKQATAGS